MCERFTDGKLNVPQAVAEGTPQNVEDMKDKLVEVTGGPFTCTFDVETSLDGVTWNLAINNINAPAAPQAVAALAKWMRVNMTAYTSGLPIVRVFGRTTR